MDRFRKHHLARDVSCPGGDLPLQRANEAIFAVASSTAISPGSIIGSLKLEIISSRQKVFPILPIQLRRIVASSFGLVPAVCHHKKPLSKFGFWMLCHPKPQGCPFDLT